MAVFHEEPDDPLRRRDAGFRAFVQRHLSSQHRYGSVGGERRKSGNGMAAVVRARRRRHAQVSSRRSLAHKQGETSLRERLHGEMDGRIVYDRRRHRSDPPVYRLVEWHGDRLEGTFYEPELQKVIVSADQTYRVEAEMRRRNNGREVLVKWFGYPESFNIWINAMTLMSYT